MRRLGPIGANLTGDRFGTDRAGDYVVAVERAPCDAGTLWAATRTGRVFVTANADAAPRLGARSARIDTPPTPGRFVTGIAIDPNDPNHAWISYTGYDAYTPDDAGARVRGDLRPDHAARRRSTDRSFNLGDQPVTALAEYGDNRRPVRRDRLRRAGAADRRDAVGAGRHAACRTSRSTG